MLQKSRNRGRVKKSCRWEAWAWRRSRQPHSWRRASGAWNPLVSRPSPRPRPAPRIGVVHDFLYTYGGAERVLEQILEVFPDADLFSLFDFLPPGRRDFIKNKPVHTSFLQRMPLARSRHRAYLPLMPIAIEQLDLSAYDIIISSSYLVAKGVLTRPGQMHVCYCHTPVRFAWDLQRQYLDQTGMASGIKSVMVRMLLHYIRQWDFNSAGRVDHFVTNSDFVASRIEQTYRRPSTTIYPPVDTSSYTLSENREDFYLTASRLVSYKRIDLMVEAFNRMPDKRLVVVGEGPELDKLRAAAGPNVRLVGHQSFENLRRYMQLARSFVFAAEEDFGITPVEAQACGTPIIAFGRGGACETVIDGVTGIFFHEQTIPSLTDAIVRFESHQWNPRAIRRNALRFSPARFRTELRDLVDAPGPTAGKSPAGQILRRSGRPTSLRTLRPTFSSYRPSTNRLPMWGHPKRSESSGTWPAHPVFRHTANTPSGSVSEAAEGKASFSRGQQRVVVAGQCAYPPRRRKSSRRRKIDVASHFAHMTFYIYPASALSRLQFRVAGSVLLSDCRLIR